MKKNNTYQYPGTTKKEVRYALFRGVIVILVIMLLTAFAISFII